ncbi:hypothetical protein BSKO_12731 [Bryopsis sp. KO-2023]|nr:hypothetical protein BSKO_12731 [Bryopsis sp. KO-2023]
MAAPWTPRQQTPPRQRQPRLEEDSVAPFYFSNIPGRRMKKSRMDSKPSSASNQANMVDKNEEMWWRSDSSLDGRELDDLDLMEDPFYDPTLDEKDAQWTAKLRRGRTSDAILNCPGCFTTLCVDCQEHSSMVGCFRAMFVMNCRVEVNRRKGFRESISTGKRLKKGDPTAGGRVVRRKLDASNENAGGGSRLIEGNGTGEEGLAVDEMASLSVNEQFTDSKLVLCNACGTEVAAYDSDEVYHFFNVFPSLA